MWHHPQSHVVHRGVPGTLNVTEAGCLNDAITRGAHVMLCLVYRHRSPRWYQSTPGYRDAD